MNTTEHIVTISTTNVVLMSNVNAVRIIAHCSGAKETAVIKYPGTKTCVCAHDTIKCSGHGIGLTRNVLVFITISMFFMLMVLTDLSVWATD